MINIGNLRKSFSLSRSTFPLIPETTGRGSWKASLAITHTPRMINRYPIQYDALSILSSVAYYPVAGRNACQIWWGAKH